MAYMENKIDELLANNGVRRIKKKKTGLRACNIHIMATNIIFKKIEDDEDENMADGKIKKTSRNQYLSLIHI